MKLVPDSKKVEMANGAIQKTKGIVSTKICFEQKPDFYYNLDASCLKGMKEDLLMDVKFMERNEISLDLKEKHYKDR